MSFFWPWSKKKQFDRIEINTRDVGNALAFLGISWQPLDKGYEILNESELKDFVFKYHDTSQLIYSKKGFPDCDDFSRICVADILKGALDSGFKNQPAFGTLTYLRKETGIRHMACIAIAKPDKVLIYEPQSLKWLIPQDEIGGNAKADL